MLQLDSLGQKELASRLTLNCTNAYIAPQKLRDLPITLIDVSRTIDSKMLMKWFNSYSLPVSLNTIILKLTDFL